MNTFDRVALLPAPAPTIGPSHAGGPEGAMLGQERWSQIKALKSSGMSISEIARRFDLDRKTVRRALAMPVWRPYTRAQREESLLSPWWSWLKQRMSEVDYSAQILFQELRAQGYAGSYETVKRVVAPHRGQAQQEALCQRRFETEPGEQAQVDYGESLVSTDKNN